MPNPVGYGQPVILTATVTAGATGKVTFYDGTAVLGVAALTGTQATLTTVLLPSGTRSLHAHYWGDASYSPSNSVPVSQSVVAGTSLGLRHAVNYPTGAAPSSVAVGDFNGDGKPDLVVSNYNADSISVLLGKGDGSFQAAMNSPLGIAPGAIAAGDFNGDGNTDLAVANTGNNVIQILLGNGDGTFQTGVSVTTSSSSSVAAQALVVGDFNGDGKPDLASGNWASNPSALSVWLGNGDGTFQTVANYAGVGPVSSVVVGDFNGDNKPDLAFASPGAVGILLGNGDGTFQAATYSSPGYGATALAVGDFNGDGKLDLVGIPQYSASFALLLGNGDGTFQASTIFLNPALSVQAEAVGDFDGDGKLDLVMTLPTFTAVAVWSGNGDGTFGTFLAYPVDSSPTSLVVSDFSGDGKADLVVANSGVSVLLGGAVPDLTAIITHGNGFTQGQIGAAYSLTISNVGDIVASGPVGVVDDLPPGFTATGISGSGWTCVLATTTCTRSDPLAVGASYPAIKITVNVAGIVTGNATNTATVSGGSDGNLANDTVTDTVLVHLTTTTSLSASPNPSVLGHAVALTAMVSSGTGKVTFYDGGTVLGIATLAAGHATLSTSLLASGSRSLTALYDGDSTYGPSTSTVWVQTVNAVAPNGWQPAAAYSVGSPTSQPGWVAVGDFNRDGKPDMVTANYNTGDVSVLVGNGDGTFEPAVRYAVLSPGNYPNSIAVDDFNGDGNADIVVASSSVYILLGKGDGTFQAPQVAGASISISDLKVMDVNRDGQPDLIGITNSNTLSVLLGNGDGTFQLPLNTATTGIQFGFWALADINRDGKLDLVVGSSGTVVSVAVGIGDGTFQLPVSYPIVSTNASALTVGDFNGDGKPDVVIASYGGLGVLFGNGDGSLQAPVSSVLGSVSPPSGLIFTGDFNGDGKLDVAYPSCCNAAIIVFGNGDGTFKPGLSLPINGNSENIVLADFNGDGLPDLAVASATPNAIYVFLGGQFSGLDVTSNHMGRFTAGQTATYQITITQHAFAAATGLVTVTDTLPAGLTATAISGTGWACTLATLTCTRSDGINTATSFPAITLTVNVAGNLSPSIITNQASVSWGGVVNTGSDPTTIVLPTTTSLTLSPSSSIQGQPVAMTVAVTSGATGTVAFFNNGAFLGSATIVGSQASSTIRILPTGLNQMWATYNGDSTHAPSRSSVHTFTVTATPASGFAPPSSYATGAGPVAIVAGDFNGDGNMDLVTANSTANTISVLMGNANGTFQTKTDYTVGTQPVSVAIGDFNGDGKADLAVANSGSRTLSILLNNGDGTFAAATSIAMVNSLSTVVVGDFDGDAKADLVVSGSTTSVLLGNGDGTFYTAPGGFGCCAGSSVFAGDFNGDGKTDLIIGGYLYLGVGDGTFQFTRYAGIDPLLVIADINEDGILDLVGTNSSRASVLLGKGDGTFQLVPQNPVASPYAMVIADVNGDGKLDVAYTDGNNSFSVLLGNGDGTLQTATTYAIGSSPRGLVAGDFNRDGRTDLAIVNNQTNNITVLLGILSPVLSVSSTHPGDFAVGGPAKYTIEVENNGPGVIAGTITVTDTLPTGLTAVSMTGTGWNCVLGTLTCTRSDSLGIASYPLITLTVNVAMNAPSQVTNQVSAFGGGSPPAYDSDLTTTSNDPVPALVSPANGSNGVPVSTSLTWNYSTGATSYDVYFGASNPPPFVTNVAMTNYTPAPLATSTQYFWKIVAQNGSGGNASAIWSFTTLPTVNVGIFRSGFYWLEDVDGNQQFNQPPDQAFAFGGVAGDIPITGDWNGDGRTKVGVYRPSNGLFILDTNGDQQFDAGDAVYNLGVGTQAGDVPVVGDWNGDGRTKVGLFRQGFFWILDTNGNGVFEQGVDATYAFGGVAGDVPVVGDWTGTGTSKIGLFRMGFYWILDANGNGSLDNINGAGGDLAFAYGGIAGDVPLVGDWNGDGTSKVGVFRQGFFWVLDANGNHQFDGTGPGQDLAFAFGGLSGDVPVVGKW